MQLTYNFSCKFFFYIHWVLTRAESCFYIINFLHWYICCQSKVFNYYLVFNRHYFPKHVLRAIFQPNGIAPRFTHFPAVCANKKFSCQNKAFFVSPLFLECATCLHVECLVCSADL